MQAPTPEITAWIADWQQGDADARDRVFTHLYPELRRLANAVLRSNADHHTLEATALLNDALMKLIQSRAPEAEDREHFARIVARAMRQILVDRARARGADKRGGGMEPLTLSHAEGIDADTPEVLDLDVALNQLDEIDGALRELVELRVFAGLTLQQVADTSGRSLRSVNRDWQRARALLLAQMD